MDIVCGIWEGDDDEDDHDDHDDDDDGDDGKGKKADDWKNRWEGEGMDGEEEGSKSAGVRLGSDLDVGGLFGIGMRIDVMIVLTVGLGLQFFL